MPSPSTTPAALGGGAGTLHSLIEIQARRAKDAPAIAAPGRAPLSYGRLHEEVSGVVTALHAMGIGQLDRVALVLENGPEMAVAFLGITAAAICSVMNPAYREGELDFYLGDLGVKALVMKAGAASPARDVARKRGIRIIELHPAPAPAEAGVFSLSSAGASSKSASPGVIRPDDVALVLHTSGTTSRPKIVPLTQANLLAAAQAIARVLELGPSDVCLNIMPLFHIHGLSTVSASLVVGASVVCAPAFDPRRFLGWIEAHKPTWTTAAPTLYHAILEVARLRPEVIARHRFRFLRSASSAMPPQVIGEIERLFQAPFIEAYGMTEASPQIASNLLPPGKRKRGSVGPAAGPEVAIVDEAGELLAAGQTGEVVIRGPNVIRGYENNLAANEAAFVEDWFRTGDQGFLDDEGYLFITGRLKEIINRGGEKISPREVDEVLLDHPAVAQAVTFSIPHFRLGEDVAAAVVLRPGATATAREIQAFAAERLIDFKVPRHVVITGKIPRGPTAKLQRIGLAEKFGLLDAAPGDDSPPPVAPRTPVEAILASIWAPILKVTPIGVLDNFFRLGGDSILALRVLSQIRASLKVALEFQDLFLNPTVAELALRVEAQQRGASGQGLAPITPLPAGAEAPLSFVQGALWFLDQLDPSDAAYNVYRAANLRGPLDPALLERSIQEIVRRHSVLRTTFPNVDGRPRAVIVDEATTPLVRVDLRALAEPARQTEAERRAVEEAGRPFDLGRGPLLRTTLLLLAPEEHLFLLTAHHIVIDLFSLEIFFHELATLYAAFAEGKPSPLPALPLQYADFAAWQRQQGPLFEAQLAYWKTQLASLPPPLPLPLDRPRASARTSRGARRFFQLPQDLGRALLDRSQKESATLFMTLLAAFSMLLARVTGQLDIVVGSPIANRSRAEIEDLIGIFSNTLVLRVRLTDNPSFREVLARVREAAHGAFAHPDLPFDKLVEGVAPSENRARMPLFQVSFRVQSDPVPPTGIPGVSQRFLKISNQMAKLDLAIEIGSTEDGLSGFIEYRTDLFNPETIERLFTDLSGLLATVVEKPDAALSSLAVSFDATRASAAAAPAAPRLKSLRDVRRKAVELLPGRKPGEGEPGGGGGGD